MPSPRLDSTAQGPNIPYDQRAEETLRLILDSIPALVNTATAAGEIDFANQRLLEYVGGTLEELQDWQPFIHEEERAKMAAAWTHSVQTGQPFKAEYRLRGADGVYRWFQSHAVPLRAQGGAIVRWYSLSIDIDDRKRTEDLLRASERRLREIIDSLPGLVAILNASGTIELVNRGVLDYFGRSLEELQQWTLGGSVHPDDLPAVVAKWQHSIATGAPFDWEHRLRRADGAYRWFQLRGLPWRDSGDQAPRWYCLVTDVHDRKMAEDRLRRSETFLLEVQRVSHTGGWRYDVALNLVESSPEIQRAYAMQPGEDPTRPPFWFERIHADDRPRVQAEFDRCMREHAEYRSGYRILLPDGSIGYQYATGHPIVNQAGDLVEFIGASMDMTEHWLATNELARASEDLRDLQTKLSHASQIATIGELAASIAHEVNQPLAAVVANGHACLRWLSAAPPNVAKAVEAAERIVKDGKDAGEVVRRVRSLFKRTAVDRVPLDINDVVREVLQLLENDVARRRVAVRTTLDPELSPVLGDRVQLQQLVLNLTLNALEAVEPVVERDRHLSIRTTQAGETHAVVEIADNGVGLSDSEVAFEPFFTTKAEGMGMGLAICRSIVAAHNGTLSATRNDGFGTTFAFRVPFQSNVQR